MKKAISRLCFAPLMALETCFRAFRRGRLRWPGE